METYGTEAARKALFSLFDAEAPTVITRDAGQGETQRAVLVPVANLTDEQRELLLSWPAHGLTDARRHLGGLVAQAAAGAPQRLRRHRHDVAVLLPHGATNTDTAAAEAGRKPVRAPRTLTRAADSLDALPATARASYGLPLLDDVSGGLLPGRFTLIAAAPGVGGSLLAAAAARHTAVVAGRPVLYAAVGPTAADVTARIGAAHAGVPYRALRAGTLDPAPQTTAALEAVHAAPLFIDDGADLDTAAIAATVPDVEGLALLVVDRLQAAADPSVPLSGPQLPAATRALGHLARSASLPVLAAIDTDDPEVLATLRADVLLHLQRDGDFARLTVSDADATGATENNTLVLVPEFDRARFLDEVTGRPTPAVTPSTPPGPSTTPHPGTASAETSAGSQTGTQSVSGPVSAAPAAADQIRVPSKSRTAARGQIAADHEAFLALPAVAKRITRKGQREALAERLALLDDPEIGEGENPSRLRLWDAIEGGSDMGEVGPFGPLKHGKKPPFWQAKQPGMSEAFRSRDGIVWSREYDGDDVVRMDRNASWPTAVSSVQVVFGEFGHVGPMVDLAGAKGVAPGYYLTHVYPWMEEGLPAPIEGKVGTDQWVTGPRMQLLADLAHEGRWPDANVLEAYNGEPYHLKEWGNLINILRRYALEVHGRDSSAYAAVKRSFGMCLGLLTGSLEGEGGMRRRRWQCKARRVDWVHTIKDQATVTMWRTADKILTAEPEHGPVAIKNTDELWLPRPAFERVTAGPKPLVRLDELGTEYGTYGTEKKSEEG